MSLTGSGLNSMRSIPTFGTVGALAEIIDNSIQWKVKDKVTNINVILIEKGNKKNVEDIIITDNGQGMGDIIDSCLYFGGGTNHGAKKGLGKFGIGLPYACCSQSTRYHVYSWQKKGEYKHVYRNHSDYKPDELVIDKKHEVLKSLPKLFNETLPELSSQESGTIVYWENCDRVDPRKAKTILKHLDALLGRTYRHFIKKDDINILWKSFSQSGTQKPISINKFSYPIKINDPLRLEASGTLLSNSPYNIPEGKHDIFEAFCDPIIIKSKPDAKLNGHIHEIKIKASLAKLETQRPNDSEGGATKIGKLCDKNIGISLVRAGRELKLSPFGFNLNNSSDPRNRWWKIEASFEPISDDILNVNANKSAALNFKHMSKDEYEDYNIDGDGKVPLDIEFRYKIACKIQSLITDMFKNKIKARGEGKRKKSKKHQKCIKCNTFSVLNGECSICGPIKLCPDHNVPFENGTCKLCDQIVTPSICVIHKEQLDNEGNCSLCLTQKTEPLSENEKSQLTRILRKYDTFNDDKIINETMNWFVRSGKKHFVLFLPDDLNPFSFINFQSYNHKFEIIFVNTLHSFYKAHIKKHFEEDSRELESLVLFIISWVNAEKHYDANPDDQKLIAQFRAHFGNKLAGNLEQWNLIHDEDQAEDLQNLL